MYINKNKNILVAGGAGFLGSHLCERLLIEGHKVYTVDNFSSGQWQNIALLNDNPLFEFIEHDIVDPLHIEVDQIYNLACPASPPNYQKDPVATMKTCVYGAANLLDLANQERAKILQASTSEIYGDPLNHPQVESDWGNVNPIGLRSCYDEGKRAAESLFFDHWRSNGTRIKVARIFNTYGPRMHPEDGRVISNFIVRALLGKPISIYGKGLQTRSFCYYSDMIDGLLALMNAGDEVTGPINLGNPVEFTMLELAAIIRDLVGNQTVFEFMALPEDDPQQRKPDISKAGELLNWKPQVALQQGLESTIVYFDDLLGNTRKLAPMPNTQIAAYNLQ